MEIFLVFYRKCDYSIFNLYYKIVVHWMKKILLYLPLFLVSLTSGILSGCASFDDKPHDQTQDQGAATQKSKGMQGVFRASPEGSQIQRGKNSENSRNTTLSNP